MQREAARRAGRPQPVSLVPELVRRGIQVNEIKGVLDQIQPQVIVHQASPALWPRPALDGKAGVNAEPVRGHMRSCRLCVAAPGRAWRASWRPATLRRWLASAAIRW